MHWQFCRLSRPQPPSTFFSHSTVNKEDSQSRDEQPCRLANDTAPLAAPACRASHDLPHPKALLDDWPSLLKRLANVAGPFPCDGRLWRRLGRTKTTSAQIRAPNVFICDCSRMRPLHLILGVFESPASLQAQVEA